MIFCQRFAENRGKRWSLGTENSKWGSWVPENVKKGTFHFRSSFSKREIKLKLGLSSEKDIIEVETKHPIESKTELQISNDVETASVIEIVSDTTSVKSSEIVPGNGNAKMAQPTQPVENQQFAPKLRLEIPELINTDYENIQNFAEDVKTFHKLMKGQWSEEEIIFSTLVKSKKTFLKACFSQYTGSRRHDHR